MAPDKRKFQAELGATTAVDSIMQLPPIRVARLSWWGFCAIILSGANIGKQFQLPSRDYEAFHSDVTVSEFVDALSFRNCPMQVSLTNRKIDSHKNTLSHATNIVHQLCVRSPSKLGFVAIAP
jgi:hypothetical protein